MVTTTETPRRQRPAPRVRAVEVRRVTQLSPQMIRVTVGGDELGGFEIAGPTGHLKLYLRQEGQQEIDFEALAAPRGQRPPSAPISRTFTPRRFNSTANELDIDFFVHGDGPAAHFAKTAQPGEIVAVSGPSRPYRIAEGAWQLIAGDETAFPAIEMICEALSPDTQGTIILEAADGEDFPALRAPEAMSVVYLVREERGTVGEPTVATLRDVDFGGGPVQAWIAGEAVAIRAARKVLLGRGLSPELLTTRGYWRYGEAGHPDHDMGED